MRPLFYSEKEASAHNIGWQRIETKSSIIETTRGKIGTIIFHLHGVSVSPHSKDTCYFAHCYPYTYTNLQEYLSGINNTQHGQSFVKYVSCATQLLEHGVYFNDTLPWRTMSQESGRPWFWLQGYIQENQQLLDHERLPRLYFRKLKWCKVASDTFAFKVVPCWIQMVWL